MRNELYTVRFKGKTLPVIFWLWLLLFVCSFLIPCTHTYELCRPICYRSPKISQLLLSFCQKKGGYLRPHDSVLSPVSSSHRKSLPHHHPALRSQREGKHETHTREMGKKKKTIFPDRKSRRFFNDHLPLLRRAQNNFTVSRSRLNNKQIIVFILVQLLCFFTFLLFFFCFILFFSLLLHAHKWEGNIPRMSMIWRTSSTNLSIL